MQLDDLIYVLLINILVSRVSKMCNIPLIRVVAARTFLNIHARFYTNRRRQRIFHLLFINVKLQ